jgi:uncharacterized membrane protein HdeD (DUF308 family)
MTATSSPNELVSGLRSSGTALLIAGALSCIAGVLALVYPDITLLALALIAGVNLFILGILGLIDAFAADEDVAARVLAGVLGLLAVIAGLVVMRRPGESLLAILLVLGIWLVVSGVVDFIRALANVLHRGLRMLSAVADFILGVLILSWPELSLATLAVLVGIGFLLHGVITVVVGIRLRRAARPAPTDAPPTSAVTA